MPLGYFFGRTPWCGQRCAQLCGGARCRRAALRWSAGTRGQGCAAPRSGRRPLTPCGRASSSGARTPAPRCRGDGGHRPPAPLCRSRGKRLRLLRAGATPWPLSASKGGRLRCRRAAGPGGYLIGSVPYRSVRRDGRGLCRGVGLAGAPCRPAPYAGRQGCIARRGCVQGRTVPAAAAYSNASAKKIASPTAQGTQLSNIRAQLLRAWGPASDHRIMAGATLCCICIISRRWPKIQIIWIFGNICADCANIAVSGCPIGYRHQ